jgi:subtilisin family serine protease
MKLLCFLATLLGILIFSTDVYGRSDSRIKIAVIDTGVDVTWASDLIPFLCKDGHKDFTGSRFGYVDTHGHGTNIAWLITQGVDSRKYCLLIYKYYQSGGLGIDNLSNEVKAFRAAIDNGAKYINLSGGGFDPSPAETMVVIEALMKKIKVVVAAGNESQEICSPHKYYPACIAPNDPNMFIVGNCVDGKYADSSNRGPSVKQCENGMYQGPPRFKMSGTSQATAIFLNKLIKSNSQP